MASGEPPKTGLQQEQADSAIAIRGTDGCVLAIRSLTGKQDSMIKCQVNCIGDSITMVTSGNVLQSELIVSQTRNCFIDYNLKHGKRMSLKELTDDLADFLHHRTLLNFLNPFKVDVIIFSWTQEGGPQLFYIRSSGESAGFFGAAVGKWQKEAHEDLRKLNFPTMTAPAALIEATRIAMKTQKLEMTANASVRGKLTLIWIGTDTGGKTQKCDAKLVRKVFAAATDNLVGFEIGM